MKRKKKNYLRLILSLIFLSFLIFFIFFLRLNIQIEEENFQFLKNSLKNKTIFKIFLSLKEIMTNYPEIIKIKTKFNPLGKKLKIKIDNAKIVAQICYLQNCFYLDNYSRIIEPGLKTQKQVLLIYSFLPIEKNSLLNPKIKNLLVLIFEYANWRPLILKEIKIYSNFDVGVIDEKNREFLFDTNKDISEQIKKLHIFLEKNFSGSRIDLRIPKKIYFK